MKDFLLNLRCRILHRKYRWNPAGCSVFLCMLCDNRVIDELIAREFANGPMIEPLSWDLTDLTCFEEYPPSVLQDWEFHDHILRGGWCEGCHAVYNYDDKSWTAPSVAGRNSN